MSSVMDTPEMIEYVETHDLTIETLEQPQPRRVRPGFWRTLAHTIAGDCTPTHQQYASSCQAHRPFETPADQLARQYPTLYLRAYCGV